MRTSILLGIVLAVAILLSASNVRLSSTSSNTIYVPHDYPTIQDAINNANDGDTIIVREGFYNEPMDVNKSVSLIGQNMPTINTTFSVWSYCNYTLIQGFKVIGGIVVGSSYAQVRSNYIIPLSTDRWWQGIWLHGNGSLIVNNTVSGFNETQPYQDLGGTGILITGSSNVISDNVIKDNLLAFGISGNLANWPRENRIYHNNILNNSKDYQGITLSVNYWDDGYPSGGNYWSDYYGTDVYSGAHQTEPGGDGIGDLPYILDEDNTDYYPLMHPYPPATYDFAIDITPTCPAPFVSSTVPREGEPVQVEANINASVDSMAMFCRATGGNWWSVSMLPGENWTQIIPGLAANTTVEFYIIAYNGFTLVATSPTCSYGVKDLPIGDINGDGIVNIVDIALAATHYGESSP